MHAGSDTPSSSSTLIETPTTTSQVVESVFTPARRHFLLLVLSLSFVAVVIFRGIHVGEFSENVDETVHAASGLYVASFIQDLPLRHPVEYTYPYYAQYPSL